MNRYVFHSETLLMIIFQFTLRNCKKAVGCIWAECCYIWVRRDIEQHNTEDATRDERSPSYHLSESPFSHFSKDTTGNKPLDRWKPDHRSSNVPPGEGFVRKIDSLGDIVVDLMPLTDQSAAELAENNPLSGCEL